VIALLCDRLCGYVANSPIGHHTMYGQLVVLTGDETAQAITE